MKKNNLIISAVLGTTLLSTNSLGDGIFLGPGGKVFSAPNMVFDSTTNNAGPLAQINSNDEQIAELIKFEKDSSSLYQLKEDDKKSWKQYGDDLLASNSDLKNIFQELDVIGKNINLPKNERNAKLHSISQQIYTNPDYTMVRIQPANQELLKLRLKKIEHERVLAPNNKVFTEVILNEIQSLKRDIAGYLVTDFQNKKIGDIPAVQQSDSDVTESLVNTSLITRGIIDERINNFSGVASGEAHEMSYGAWAQGVLSQGVQKSFNNSSGYKFNQTGGTVGVDIGATSVFGVAYSYLTGNVQNKDKKTNKSTVETHAVTLYGKVSFTDAMFATGQTQFGVTKIKTKRATGDIANNIATSAPKGDTMLGKMEVGYDLTYSPTIHIIPTVGIAYTSAHVKDYTEKGDGLNRTVGDRKTNRTSGIANITAQYVLDTGYGKIIPELHAGIDYAFTSNNSGTEVKVIDVIDEITTPSKKLDKSFYKIGVGIKTIQSSNYELSAGYDMGFAKKFQSHTGTLKLRVNL